MSPPHTSFHLAHFQYPPIAPVVRIQLQRDPSERSPVSACWHARLPAIDQARVLGTACSVLTDSFFCWCPVEVPRCESSVLGASSRAKLSFYSIEIGPVVADWELGDSHLHVYVGRMLTRLAKVFSASLRPARILRQRNGLCISKRGHQAIFGT